MINWMYLWVNYSICLCFWRRFVIRRVGDGFTWELREPVFSYSGFCIESIARVAVLHLRGKR